MSLYAVGFHGAHGDALLGSLTDVVTLKKRKPRHSQLIVLGDFNVDLLPILEQDPWHDLPNRTQDHRDRRAVLENLCQALKLETAVPDLVVGSPGGPFKDAAPFVPFTRIPTGACAGQQVPSLLDYFLLPIGQSFISDT